MNRITRYCHGLMEAAWLAAFIVTPLMMSLNGSAANTIKVVLLRSIILIGVGAWWVLWVGELSWKPLPMSIPWRVRFAGFVKQPFVVPVLAFLFAVLLSTALSISPRASLQGSYARRDGLYTFISYLLLFGLMGAYLRQRAQLDRLAAVIAGVSFAVDWYAILQHVGLDPMPWVDNMVTLRAPSTIGYSIFTAAFLAFTTFLLLGRMLLAFHDWKVEGKRPVEIVRAALFGLVAGLNLLAIWFTASRGPLLGLFAGMGFFVLVLSLYWKNKKLQFSALILGIVLISVLVLLYIPGGPLAQADVTAEDSLGRLAQPLDSATGRSRTLIWQGVAQLVLPHAPITFPDNTADRLNILRPLIGYGPETLSLVFSGQYSPEMYAIEKRYVQYDRAHNEFWNTAASMGLLGVLAEYGLFLSVFFYGLRWLGVILTRFDRNMYWGLALMGGVLGGLGSVFFGGVSMLGLGLPVGFLAGPAGIIIIGIFRKQSARDLPMKDCQSLTVISILAAFFSHYIEILFGITVVTSSLLLWGSLAILLFVSRPIENNGQTAAILPAAQRAATFKKGNSGIRQSPAWFAQALKTLPRAAGLTLFVLALGAGFVVIFQAGDTITATLLNAFTSIPTPARHVSYGVISLLISTLLFVALLFHLESANRQDWKWTLVAIGLALTGSWSVFAIRANQLIGMQTATVMADTAALVSENLLAAGGMFALILLLCLTWAIGLQLQYTQDMQPYSRRWQGVLASVGGLAVLFYLNLMLNVLPVQADMLMTLVKTENAAGRHASAIHVYKNVLRLAPVEPFYLANAEKVFMDAINTSPDVQVKERLFVEGLGFIQNAFSLEPLYVDVNMALARFYRLGGDIALDDSQKIMRYDRANQLFSTALAACPSRADYWLAWADFLVATGNLPDAYEKANAAVIADRQSVQAYQFIGNLYVFEAGAQTESLEQTILYMKAIQAHQKQKELLIARGENPAQAILSIGQVYEKMQKYESARGSFLDALSQGVGNAEWKVYKELADLSASLDDVAAQRAYLQKALNLAPGDEQPAIQQELDALPVP